MNQELITQRLKELGYLAAGAAIATVGLKGFVLPNNLLDGGVTGVSLLTNRLFPEVDLGVALVFWNAPLIALGWFKLGKGFALRSGLAIVLLSTFVFSLPVEQMTDQRILGALFGGVFLGGGIGLALRAPGVLDGSEVLAVLVSRRWPMAVGEFILVFNVVLFTVAGFLFSLDMALFSVVTYFAASRSLQFVAEGLEAYTGMLVVSAQADEIRRRLLEKLGRGVTVLEGEGGRSGEDRQVLYCVVTRLEIPKVHQEVLQADPNAFISQWGITETIGGRLKHRPLACL